MKIEMWDVGRVKPYPGNPRQNQGAVDTVAKSIKEFGWRQPIVVDPKGVIIVGHTRRLAAIQLKHKKVPVTVAKDLKPAQIRAYRLMDNRAHEDALWDETALAKELKELLASGTAVEMTGFSDSEMQRLIGDLPSAELPAAPESVQKNIDRLADVKAQRAKGNAGVISKSDTEHYLIVVYPDRASRENAVKRLGLPPDERYVDSAAVELRQRVGGQRELQVRAQRKTAAAPANKSGATG